MKNKIAASSAGRGAGLIFMVAFFTENSSLFSGKFSGVLMVQRLDDFFRHLLGVGKQHHGVVAEEQLILHPGITTAHAALDEQHGLGLFHIQDRHAENRRFGIGLGAGIGDVIGADHIGD